MSTEKVIPTAWIVAHCRTFTDIPYVKEIFEELEKERINKNEEFPEIVKDTRLAPSFEARYKLTRRLLKEKKAKQILEIAAGFSPRGMEMSEDKSLLYVETDFQVLIEEKRKTASRLMSKPAENLFFEKADALNLNELEDACRHFDPSKNIAIVNEGLLRYLSFDQKKIVANNVKNLLEQFGGFWITPDISKKQPAHVLRAAEGFGDEVTKIVEINIQENLFDDEDHARRFFQDLGFDIESHAFIEEKDGLVSPDKLGISSEKVEAMLKRSKVFIMTLRK